MARLIDADALIEKMRFDVCTDCLGGIKGCGNCYYDRAIDAIEDAPTVDAVEVVRCKNCVHYGGVTFGFMCRKFSGIDTKICMPADGYCSYGERKVGE